jgi:hypothetical protein
MARRPASRGRDRSVALFLIASLSVTAPALSVWVAPGMPWWSVYALWSLLIAGAAGIAWRNR